MCHDILLASWSWVLEGWLGAAAGLGDVWDYIERRVLPGIARVESWEGEASGPSGGRERAEPAILEKAWNHVPVEGLVHPSFPSSVDLARARQPGLSGSFCIAAISYSRSHQHGSSGSSSLLGFGTSFVPSVCLVLDPPHCSLSSGSSLLALTSGGFLDRRWPRTSAASCVGKSIQGPMV